MSYFAAVLARSAGAWRAVEVDLDDCESLDDVVEVARDVSGDLRLLVVEQDDEYAVLARVDEGDNPRVFLSDGHAADAYSIAALVADEVDEIGEDVLDGDEDAPPAHDSAPFGDAALVEDLGTPGGALLELCAREGTLPIDVIVAVCEKAGCADAFEALRV
jgi:putative tRNA adenosine deaminase-associated protein